MPKIILLTHEFSPFKGGVAVYCREVHDAARRLGLPFEIWCPQGSMEGQGILHLKCGRRLHPWDLYRMARELREKSAILKGADLVLCSYGAHIAAALAILLGGLKDCRVSSLLHGSEIPRFCRNAAWRLFATILFRKVSTVFCNSGYTKDLFEKSPLFFISKFQTILAPCAPSTPATQSVPEKTPGDNNFKILTLARIHPRKGQLDVAAALGFLPSEIRQRVVYTLAGAGDAAYLESVIQRCVQGDVRFEYAGEISDGEMAAAYASCDLFVMASRTLKDSVEGFGISFLEAGWHGKPSVAYDSGGVREAIADKETGRLVAEGNLEALSEAICGLIRNPDKLREMGATAREYARSFQWGTAATRIYSHLVAPKS